MDFYTSIATVVSNNSQFLLLLVVTYCVLKIVHLEKEVKYLRYDHLCLKEMVLDEEVDEQDTDEGDENEDDEKDADYDPEEESSDSSDEGDQAI